MVNHRNDIGRSQAQRPVGRTTGYDDGFESCEEDTSHGSEPSGRITGTV